MKKVSKTARGARNAGALANAAGLTLIMGLVNVALAADVSIVVSNPAFDVDGITITPGSGSGSHMGQKQFQNASVKALITNSGTTTSEGEWANTNTNGGELRATAMGNRSDQDIDLSLITVGDDFSIATGQVTKLTHQSGGIVVNATIENSPLADTTFTSGSDVTTAGNTALATAIANQSLATVEDNFGNGFSAPIPSGSASVAISNPSTTSVNRAETTANGGIANLQHTDMHGTNVGSGAWIDNSGVSVDATGAGSTVNADDAITITGNTIGARYGANDTANVYAGNAVVHDGSTAISNLQDNNTRVALSQPAPPIPATALIKNSGINVAAEGNSVDGVVNVTGNALAARSSGNTAQNELALDPVTLQGNGGAPDVDITIDASGSNATVNALADNATLAIVSGQRNYGRLESKISDSDVAVTSSGGSGAITIAGNTSIAEVGANDANNKISVQAGNITGAGTAIVNAQLNRSSTLSAKNSTDVAIDFDNSLSAGTEPDLTITDNSIGTRARGNVASNTLVSSASGSQDSTAHILQNEQHSVLGQINATTTSDIGVTTHGVIDGTVDVLGNTVSSSALANHADNALTLDAAAALSVSAGINLANIQVSTDTIMATTTGSALISAEPGSISIFGFQIPLASAMDADTNVLDNLIQATATASSAQNTLGVTSTGSLDASSGLALSNVQTSTSTVTASSDGSIGVQAIEPSFLGNTINGDATVAGNTIGAAATGNVAENTLNMHAGTSLTTGSTSTLDNAQTSGAGIEATTNGTIGIQAAGISLVGNAVTGDATVSNNTLASTALANLATNVMDVSAGTSIVADGALSLVNTQTSSGDVGAATDGSIGIQAHQSTIANLITGDAIVSGNTLSAVGAQNVANNTLSVVGNTAAGDTVRLGNKQTASGDTTVRVTSTDLLGIQAYGPALAGISGDAVVTGNTLASRAWGNDASNVLSVGGSVQNNADATLSNTQSNSGIVRATTALNAGMGIYTSGMMGGDSTPVASQNAMLASAYGNSAVNVLNAGSGTAALSGALSSSSTQTNTAPISASVNNPGSGPGVGITSNGSMGSGAAIAGNQITASAYGNVSNSSLNASSLYGMGLASASMMTTQSNTAAVTATVSNMGMGITSGGTASGSSTISNNTVSATAVGNAAVSRIVVGN